jgi:hypothetical protein
MFYYGPHENIQSVFSELKKMRDAAIEVLTCHICIEPMKPNGKGAFLCDFCDVPTYDGDFTIQQALGMKE